MICDTYFVNHRAVTIKGPLVGEIRKYVTFVNRSRSIHPYTRIDQRKIS
jgi:hypothetical protein